MDDLEEALILSDVGVDTTEAVLERLASVPHGKLMWTAGLMTMLREEVLGLITRDEGSALTDSSAYEVPRGNGPHVIPSWASMGGENPPLPSLPTGTRAKD